MAVELFDNASSVGTSTFLTASIGDTDTVLPVADVASPDLQQPGGQFRIIVIDLQSGESELMMVVGQQWTPNWEVQRGIEGTAQREFPSGSVVKHILTAGSLGELIAQGQAQQSVQASNQVNGNYTFKLSDAGKIVESESPLAVTWTIPDDSLENFPINATIDLFQYGIGTVNIATSGIATLIAPGGQAKIAGQYSRARLWQRALNQWVLSPLDSSEIVTPATFPPGAAFYDVVGNSIPGGGGTTNGEWNGYVDKLMFLLGSPRRKRNMAVGGSVSCWQSNQNKTGDGGWGHVIQYLVPPGLGSGSAPYLPQSDIAVVHAALNDLGSLGQGNPTPMKEAHRFILSRNVACVLAQSTDSAFTFTGTWSLASVPGFNSPAGFKWTGTANDQVSLAIPSDYPGGRTVAINLVINPAHDVTASVTIDGVAQPDVRLQGSVLCDPNGFAAFGTAQFNVKCLRYSIPSAGAHTVVVKLKTINIAGSRLQVDSAHIESDPTDGPVVLVPNPHRCVDYSLWGAASWFAGASMSDAAVLSWQGSLSSVTAEFPHAMVVDIDSALNKSPALFASDNAHPNDAGHGVIARTAYDLLLSSGRLTSRRLARVSPLLNGPYWIPVGAAINGYPAFATGWVNYGSPYAPIGFHKDTLGRVHLRGAGKNGTANSLMFTLPPGYRPAATREFPGAAAGGVIGMVQVSSNGQVGFIAGGSSTLSGLDGISFVAEA